MRKFLKGKRHPSEAVDFQTSKCLYEVKSCKLILEGDNGSGALTHKLGRFYIVGYNHDELRNIAEYEEKKPRYLFAVRLGKQLVWKTISWDTVEILRKDYFGEEYYEKDFDKSKPFLIRILDVFREMGQ